MIVRLTISAISFLIVSSMALFAADAQTPNSRSHDQKFANGLRQRQLYSLANQFCVERLKNANLNDQQKAELAIEHLKTLTAQAVNAPPAQQGKAWSQLEKTSSNYLQDFRGRARNILVIVQDALIPLTHAKSLRREMEFRDQKNAAQRQQTLALLRRAIDKLQVALREVNRLKAERTREKPIDEQYLFASQLATLQHNVQFQIATCNLNRAQLYPATDRVNRTDTLKQVNDQLKAIRRQITQGDSLWFEIQLQQIEVERLSNNLAGARKLIQDLQKSNWGTVQQQRLRHQTLELGLADNTFPEMARQLDLEDFQCHSFQPLDITLVKLALKMAEREKLVTQKKRWQQVAVGFSEQIKQTHGTYWGRMSDLLMVDVARTAKLPSNVEILIRLAEQHVRKNEIKEAIEVFDSAYDIAVEQNQNDSAFAIAYRAAAVMQKLKKHDEASLRLRLLANRFTEHKSAPQAHLMACWNKAQAARGSSEKTSEYEKMLTEHVNNWPKSSVSAQARTWLARLLQHQKKYNKAFETYASIPLEKKQFKENIDQLISCGTLAASRSADEKQTDALMELCRKLMKGEREKWKPSQRRIAVLLAQIQIQNKKQTQESIDLLNFVIDHEQAEPSEKLSARIWLLIAFSADPKRKEDAKKLLQALQVRSEDSQTWLQGFAGVDPTFQSSTASEIKLAVANQIKPPAADAAKWKLLKAKSQLSVGKADEAVKTFSNLIESNPRNFRYQLEYARALTTQDKQDSKEKALRQWRVIARKTRPNSETWMEAKYHVALMQHRLGQSKQAVQLIRYLEQTAKNWKDNPWHSKFTDLLKQASASK